MDMAPQPLHASSLLVVFRFRARTLLIRELRRISVVGVDRSRPRARQRARPWEVGATSAGHGRGDNHSFVRKGPPHWSAISRRGTWSLLNGLVRSTLGLMKKLTCKAIGQMRQASGLRWQGMRAVARGGEREGWVCPALGACFEVISDLTILSKPDMISLVSSISMTSYCAKHLEFQPYSRKMRD